MIEFELLATGYFSHSQVRISYDPSLHMPHTPTIQAWMDDLWTQLLQHAQQRNVPLFDAPLFRFVAAHVDNECLYLTLGDTGYKEYVTTRTPDFAQAHTRSEPGNALAVCSVVETSDGSILLDKRQGVDVYEGRYHVIGGFFERVLDTTNNQPDPFKAMRREIREETGIQETDIAEQHCLGLVYDLATPHAELCFLTKLNISQKDVLTRKPEVNEIQQLQWLHVTEQSLHEFILNHHGNISTTGEPNLLLYGQIKFGKDWFDEVIGLIC